MTITTAQALSWRARRQHLGRSGSGVGGAGTVADVVRRLVAVPASSGDADLAIRRRTAGPAPAGEVARALDDGRLLKTYAFRGATHLMSPEDAGACLALRAVGRQWELPSWRTFYGLQPQDWPALRAVVRTALAGATLTRDELVGAVTDERRFAHLAHALASPSDTLLKPLAWQGDLCLGPSRDGRATFRSPASCPGWGGIADVDDAGPAAVLAYLGAYGPATPAHLRYWLGEGLSAGRRRIDGWLADLATGPDRPDGTGGRVAEVAVDGEPMLLAREHLGGLAAADPTDDVVLLAGHDPWVLGPGTADARVVPPERRALVTRGANLVLRGGVVSGVWRLRGDALAVTWFQEAGAPPGDAIAVEADRLAGLVGRPLGLDVEAA